MGAQRFCGFTIWKSTTFSQDKGQVKTFLFLAKRGENNHFQISPEDSSLQMTTEQGKIHFFIQHQGREMT